MFYNRGEVLSDQFDHLTMIQRLSTIVALMLSQKKLRDYLGIFPIWGGGVPPFPNLVIKIPSKMGFFL